MRNVIEPTNRKLIYIASPYWSDDKLTRESNVLRQREAALALMEVGFLTYWPLSSHYLATVPWCSMKEQDWLVLSCAMIPRCDALLRLSGKSKGAATEVQIAHKLNLPIYHELSELLTVSPIQGRR
jgi:hypothetical protein